jgi:hypothetical protein
MPQGFFRAQIFDQDQTANGETITLLCDRSANLYQFIPT